MTLIATVSVVLASRNRTSTLDASMRSVLDGTYDDLELIVVDDASEDGSVAVAKSFDDPRVRVIELSERVGAAEARNVGIRHARGRLVAFQDSDDLWTEDHLALLVRAIDRAPEAAVAFGKVRFDTGSVVPGPLDGVNSGDLRRLLPRYNVIGLPAALVRRSVIREVEAFDPTLPRLQDWDLFLSIARAHHFAFVDHVVVHAGGGAGRISTDQRNYFTALERILDRHEPLFDALPECAVAYRMQLVRHAIRQRRVRAVGRHLLGAFRHPHGIVRWHRARSGGGRSPVARH